MLNTEITHSHDQQNELFDYFNGAPIGLHLTGPDGTIRRTNLAELELLGYSGHESEYIGRHFAEFHADSEAVQAMFDRVSAGEEVVEHEAVLVRRDGTLQKVLLYVNAKTKDSDFNGLRCFTFPHPDELRPDISEVGALRDTSVEDLALNSKSEDPEEAYLELEDFFDNAPVALHIVGGDGLVKRANKVELQSMGYDADSYLGEHIAKFHADQNVIDGMLTDLVDGTPLINFDATLSDKDGNEKPVMIYSNSRMRDGDFLNTRCFTVPVPHSRKKMIDEVPKFAWPRNEDFGFTVAGRESTQSKPNPMTLALKYIAARKRPEESLGFLAQLSETLGEQQPFDEIIANALKLGVPFLADFISVHRGSESPVYAGTQAISERASSILDILAADHVAKLSTNSAEEQGGVVSIFDMNANAANTDLLGLGVRSLMMVPLTIRGQRVGAIVYIRDDQTSNRNFGPADLALGEEVARRISCAVEIFQLSKKK